MEFCCKYVRKMINKVKFNLELWISALSFGTILGSFVVTPRGK